MADWPTNEQRGRCDTTGKVRLSRDDARLAAKMLNRRQQRDRDPVHAYLCRDCGRWHTGHAGPRAKAADKDRKRKGGKGMRGPRPVATWRDEVTGG